MMAMGEILLSNNLDIEQVLAHVYVFISHNEMPPKHGMTYGYDEWIVPNYCGP